MNASSLGYLRWFMSIRISHIKDHYISVYRARYDTSIVAKYLNTATFKTSTQCCKTTFLSDMIFIKDDASNSYEQVYKWTREFNIYYRACIVSLIYLLSTRVYLSFIVHKLAKFSSNPVKVFLYLIYINKCTYPSKCTLPGLYDNFAKLRTVELKYSLVDNK